MTTPGPVYPQVPRITPTALKPAAANQENRDDEPQATIRGQNGAYSQNPYGLAPGSQIHPRQPMNASGGFYGNAPANNYAPPTQHGVTTNQPFQPSAQTRTLFQPPPGAQRQPGGQLPPGGQLLPGGQLPNLPGPGGLIQPQIQDPGLGGAFVQPGPTVPFDIYVQEARTGRFMFGAGINSDAGVTGQIVIDERNFDIFRFPRSWDDVVQGRAWRGRGQGFRIEAMPGELVQRYLVSFTEPYLLNTPVSLNVSGFLYDRRFEDWDEQRLGGRPALGYRLTPDLSISASVRLEHVDIHDVRVTGVPELDAAVGEHDLFGGRVTLTHDTRDTPFLPTEGHFMELSFEQTFGSFDYPRGEIDYRRYFLIRERPDGSGRHTLSASLRAGASGSQTPIFENFFAGGFSTIRGFDFRGASPKVGSVTVGGEFLLLGTFEYMMPLTADDMVRAVAFVDYGTVEPKVQFDADTFRVAPGVGLRIAIPAMGPAPLALDFAFPITKADTDDTQVFSFFIGFGR